MADFDYAASLSKTLGVPGPSTGNPWEDYLREVETKHGLPLGIMKAIRQIETGGVAGDPNLAVSSAGAQGMFQMKPETAGDYAPGANLQDPRTAAELAAQHLGRLKSSYNITDPLKLAMTYQMGEGAAQKYNLSGLTDFSGLPRETQNYAKKFQQYYQPAGAPSQFVAPSPNAVALSSLGPRGPLQSPGPPPEIDYAASLKTALGQEPTLAESIANKAGAVADFFGRISQAPGIKQFGEVWGYQKGALERNVLSPLLGYDPTKETFGSQSRKLLGGAIEEATGLKAPPVVAGLAGGAWQTLADLATDPVVLELEALGAALGTLGGPAGMAAGAAAGGVVGGVRQALAKFFFNNQGLHRNLRWVGKWVVEKGFQVQMGLGAGEKLPRAVEGIALNPNDPNAYSNLAMGLIDAYFLAKPLIPKAVSKGVGQLQLPDGSVIRIEGPDGSLVSLNEAALYTQDPTGLALLKLALQKRGAAWDALARSGRYGPDADPTKAPELIITHGELVGEAAPEVGAWVKFNPTRLASELLLAPEGQRAPFLKQRLDAWLVHELSHWEKEYGLEHAIDEGHRMDLHRLYQEYQADLEPMAQRLEERRDFLEKQHTPVETDPLFSQMLQEAEARRQQFRLTREQFFKQRGVDPNSVEQESRYQANAQRNMVELQPVLDAEHASWEAAFQPEGGLEQAIANFIGAAEKVQGLTGRQLLHPEAQAYAQELLQGKRQPLTPEEQLANTQRVYDLLHSAQAIPEPPVRPAPPAAPKVDFAALQRPFRPSKKWGAVGGMGVEGVRQRLEADRAIAEDGFRRATTPEDKQWWYEQLQQAEAGLQAAVPPTLPTPPPREGVEAKLPRYEKEGVERPYVSITGRTPREIREQGAAALPAEITAGEVGRLIRENELLKELGFAAPKGAGAEAEAGKVQRAGVREAYPLGKEERVLRRPTIAPVLKAMRKMLTPEERQRFDVLMSKGGLGEALITPRLEGELRALLGSPELLARQIPSAVYREERYKQMTPVGEKERVKRIPLKQLIEQKQVTPEEIAKTPVDLAELQKFLGAKYRPEQFEYSNLGRAIAAAIAQGKGRLPLNEILTGLGGKPLSYALGVHRFTPETGKTIGETTALPGSREYRELIAATEASRLSDPLHWRPEDVPGAVAEARLSTRDIEGVPTSVIEEAQNLAKGVEGKVGPTGETEVKVGKLRGLGIPYRGAGEAVPGVTKGVRLSATAAAADAIRKGETQLAWVSPRSAVDKFGTTAFYWEPNDRGTFDLYFSDQAKVAKVGGTRAGLRTGEHFEIDPNDPRAGEQLQNFIETYSPYAAYPGAGLGTQEIFRQKAARQAEEILGQIQKGTGRGLLTPERANYRRMYGPGGEVEREVRGFAEREGLGLEPLTPGGIAARPGAAPPLFPIPESAETPETLARMGKPFGFAGVGGTLPPSQKLLGRRHFARGFRFTGPPEAFERIKSRGGLAAGGGFGLRPEETRLAYDPETGKTSWPYREGARPVPLMGDLLKEKVANPKLADMKSPSGWLKVIDQKFKAEGVSEDALRWSGLREYLNEKDAAGEKVTQQELVDHVARHSFAPYRVERAGEFTPPEDLEAYKTQPEYLAAKETLARVDRFVGEVASPDKFLKKLGVPGLETATTIDEFARNLVSKLHRRQGDDPNAVLDRQYAENDTKEAYRSYLRVFADQLPIVKKIDSTLSALTKFLKGEPLTKGNADELIANYSSLADWAHILRGVEWKKVGRTKQITLADIREGVKGSYAWQDVQANLLDAEGKPDEVRITQYGKTRKTNAEKKVAQQVAYLLQYGTGNSDSASAFKSIWPEYSADLQRRSDPWLYQNDMYNKSDSPLRQMVSKLIEETPAEDAKKLTKSLEDQRKAQATIYDLEEQSRQDLDMGAHYAEWNRASFQPMAPGGAAKETAFRPGSEPYISDRLLSDLGYDPVPEVRETTDWQGKPVFEAVIRPSAVAGPPRPTLAPGMETALEREPVPAGVSATRATPAELQRAGAAERVSERTGQGATREEAIAEARRAAVTSHEVGRVEIGKGIAYGHSSFGEGTVMHHRGEATKLPVSLGGDPKTTRDDVGIMGEFQSDVFQRIEKVANTGLTKQGFPDYGWRQRQRAFHAASYHLTHAAEQLATQVPPSPEQQGGRYRLEQEGWKVLDWDAAAPEERTTGRLAEPSQALSDLVHAYQEARQAQDPLLQMRDPRYFSAYDFTHWAMYTPEGKPAYQKYLESEMAEWRKKYPEAQATKEKVDRLNALALLTRDLSEAYAKSPYIAPWNKDWGEVSVKATLADFIDRGFQHAMLRDAAYAKTSAGAQGMQWKRLENGNWEINPVGASFPPPRLATSREMQERFIGPEEPEAAREARGLEPAAPVLPRMVQEPSLQTPYSGGTIEISPEEATALRKQVSDFHELLKMTVERPENFDVAMTKFGGVHQPGEVVMSPQARARIEELIKSNPYSLKNHQLWKWADNALGSQDWSNVPDLWKYSRILREMDGVLSAIEGGKEGTTLKRAEGFDAWYEGQAKRAEKILRKMGWKGEVQRIQGDEFPNPRPGEKVSGTPTAPATHLWGWLFKNIPTKEEVLKDPQKLSALMASKGGLGFDPLRDGNGKDLQAQGLSITPRPYNKDAWNESLTKVDHPLWEAINAPRALITSLDLSGVLRQGLVGTARQVLTSPGRLARNFKTSLDALRSEETYNKSMLALENHPDMPELKKYGMEFAHKEEAYAGTRVLTTLAKKFGLPDFPRASERAYTYYLNRLRFDLAKDKFDRLKNMGFEPEKDRWLFESAAKWSNIITGRGNLPTGKDPFSQAARSAEGIMNTLMFSPRLMLSRMAMLNPYVYGRTAIAAGQRKGTAAAAGAFWAVHGMDIAAVAGLAGALSAGMAAAFGGKIEDDPRSSDFAQVKIGNTRVDLTGGLRTYITTAARLITGESKSTIGGGIREVGALETIGRFFRGKLSPVPGTVADILAGRAVTGKEIGGPLKDIMSGEEPLTKESATAAAQALLEGPISSLTIPMVLRDLKNLYDEDPAQAIGLAAPLVLGAGVTVHSLEGGLTPKVRDVFQRTMIEPMAAMRGVGTGMKDYAGKQITLPVPYMLRKQIEAEVDTPIYEKIEQIVSTPQFEAMSPIAQRVALLTMFGPLYKYRRAKAMKLMGKERVMAGVKEAMIPKEWKTLGGPPFLPGMEGAPELPAYD